MRDAKLIRILLTVTLFVCLFTNVDAQTRHSSSSRFGIKGGIGFSSLSDAEFGDINESMNSRTGFNVGIVYQYKFPVWGLAIQPEVNYVSKGARVDGDMDLKVRMDYVEVPVSLQMGFDLMLFRPFIQVTPFVSYAVLNDWTANKEKVLSWSNMNRFDYGVGIGGGVDIWRFQIAARYSWAFANVCKPLPEGTIADPVLKSVVDRVGDSSFRGLEVSLYFFF